MFNDIVDIFWRLLAIIIAIFTFVYTIIYYMIAISFIGAGACFSLLAWCIFRAIFQSVAENIPLKQYFDRRLQEDFLQKIKDMAIEEHDTRTRLAQIIEDVKLQNEANNSLLKDIRINVAIMKRKLRHFEPLDIDRCQVYPTIPGMLVPEHQEPESPSPSAFIRWLFAQDLNLYHHECTIAKYEAQIFGEQRKIQRLDEEEAYLKATLDDTNTKRSRAQHLPDLPKPYRMSESTRKYLNQFDPARVVPGPYPYYIRPSEYRPISPPPMARKPEPFQVQIPKMTLGPLLEAASRPPPPTPLSMAPSRNLDALFADPPRVVVGNSVSAPAPLFGPPAAAPVPAPAPATPFVAPAAPAAPASPPPAPKPLSLADRLTDPTGVRARLPDRPLEAPAAAPPPPTNPLSLAARLTDPAGVRAPPPPPPSQPSSLFANPAQPAGDRQAVEIEAASGRRKAREADRELARDLLAARLGFPKCEM